MKKEHLRITLFFEIMKILGETKNNLLKADLGAEVQQWQTKAMMLQRQPKAYGVWGMPVG